MHAEGQLWPSDDDDDDDFDGHTVDPAMQAMEARMPMKHPANWSAPITMVPFFKEAQPQKLSNFGNATILCAMSEILRGG